MNRLVRIILVIVVVVFTVILVITTREKTPVDNQPPAEAAATIFPIYDIARNIGGEAVRVELILSPGNSPHTFDPTPGTIRKVQDVQVVFAVGHGLDEWAADLAEISGAEVKTVDGLISLHEENGEIDPHYWLDLNNGALIAQSIAADLSERFPERAADFEMNLASYLTEIESAQYRQLLIQDEIENKKIVTLHDAWYYFVIDNGLEILETFEPSPGQEPTPQSLAQLIRVVEESQATVLYTEPQLSSASITAFANDNNLTIIEIDPLGGVEGRNSYIDLLLYNVQEVAQNQ